MSIRLQTGKLLKKLFHPAAGLHLDYQKQPSLQRPLTRLHSVPETELILPLQQHMGHKPVLRVKPGDYVYKGQPLAAAEADMSVPVHASSSGTVVAIEERPVPHPSGLSDLCVILRPDGRHDCGDSGMEPITDYEQASEETLRQRIGEAGIVGLGGAVFPAAIKLKVRPTVPIRTLVINGAECEPYITCDDRLMRDKAEEIIIGAQIMLHILKDHAPDQGVQQCLIGIEDNKPEAIAAMQAAVDRTADTRLKVVAVPTLYPAGGEKQLIKALTGKEVPSSKRPADIGMICHNVATSRAIYRAIVLGEPLISRYVTVTGPGIREPQNVEVAFGTPIAAVIDYAGGYTDQAGQLVMGGPMMGVSLNNDAIPVVKATNCILVQPAPQTVQTTLPCIRCGQCAQVCPAGLLPQQLYWHARAKAFEQTEAYNLFDCIECGCCAYVCPSHIPLVDYYRFAKSEVRARQQAKQKAELARERHEFHLERLERAKRERAEKLAKHKKKAVSADKKDAIQAALERAKAKKAKAVANNNADNQAKATEKTPPAKPAEAAEASKS
ncbi:MAG: electron transport complex subunit RsxC [Thiothrix nivea]|nr:MAG: electron transport complex subunit RsxC [Thiothrix nivea]